MNKLSQVILLASLTMCCSTALAGAYVNSLANCMITVMQPADLSIMVKWVYGAIGAHPDVGRNV